MPTLSEKLLSPANRPKVVDDCVTLVDEEVASKSGLSGMAVKMAYGTAKTFKHGFVKEVVEAMLDEFVGKLEPFYATRGDKPVADYLSGRAADVAEALLQITDARAQKTKHGSLKGIYEKMRPSAKKNVEAAVPRIGRLVAKYAA